MSDKNPAALAIEQEIERTKKCLAQAHAARDQLLREIQDLEARLSVATKAAHEAFLQANEAESTLEALERSLAVLIEHLATPDVKPDLIPPYAAPRARVALPELDESLRARREKKPTSTQVAMTTHHGKGGIGRPHHGSPSYWASVTEDVPAREESKYAKSYETMELLALYLRDYGPSCQADMWKDLNLRTAAVSQAMYWLRKEGINIGRDLYKAIWTGETETKYGRPSNIWRIEKQ